MLTHARSFFPGFKAERTDDAGLHEQLKKVAPRFSDYFTAILLDFATIDPDLEDRALSAAMEWSDVCNIAPAFDKFAAEELALRARDLKKLRTKSTAAASITNP